MIAVVVKPVSPRIAELMLARQRGDVKASLRLRHWTRRHRVVEPTILQPGVWYSLRPGSAVTSVFVANVGTWRAF